MATVMRLSNGNYRLLVKGASERILDRWVGWWQSVTGWKRIYINQRLLYTEVICLIAHKASQSR